MKKKFRLNRRDRKLMGVCAGLSDMTGVDATIIRIAVVLLTIAGGFPWTLIAYLVAGWAAKPALLGFEAEAARGRMTMDEYQAGLTDSDRKLDEVDRYVASSAEGSLAREIERLR